MTTLAVQLYSLRDAGPLDDQLRLVRDAGITAVELHSANFADPAATRAALDWAGLTTVSGHIGLDRLEDTTALVAAAHVLGLGGVVLWGFDEEDLGPDPAVWRARGRLLGDHARRLADHGLTLAFHNHDWELRRIGNDLALDVLFEAAGKSLGWQADLAWLARGGADVPALLARHGARLRSAHVKDLAPAGTEAEEGWADLGHGTLPWTDWLAALDPLSPAFLALEHDAPSDPARFVARSAAAFRQLTAPEVTA